MPELIGRSYELPRVIEVGTLQPVTMTFAVAAIFEELYRNKIDILSPTIKDVKDRICTSDMLSAALQKATGRSTKTNTIGTYVSTMRGVLNKAGGRQYPKLGSQLIHDIKLPPTPAELERGKEGAPVG